MNLLRKGSIFHFLSSTNGAVTAATISIIILCVVIVVNITGLNIFQILMKLVNFITKLFSGFINKKETNYHRDLEIGKINEKRNRVKIYRFLNDLTIDLGLKQQGASPYEFLFIVAILTALGTIVLTELLFGSIVMSLLLFPIMLCGVICVLYTRANIAHDRRIEAIIEAENIICNNISAGVLVAVKNSINVIPQEVRGEFRDFIDNNLNEIAALNIVATRPKELTRKALKELKTILDREHFSETMLQTAWKEMTNEDIAADIISFIRQRSIGDALISKDDRIHNAIAKTKANHPELSKIQLGWLDRIEAQLLKEVVLNRETFDSEAFKNKGGYNAVNKAFGQKLDEFIDEINGYMYSA